jgi:hypothetical protein
MGWGQGGEMTQALYAHMNNKIIKINKNKNNLFTILRIVSQFELEKKL